jgi:anti-sigma-K factor RskA
MTTSDVHALSGAYALDAVDDLERAAVERHLRDCPTCAAEVRELRDTVARLADDVAISPPPNLRAAVLGAVARTPQVRPSGPDRSQTTAVTRWRRWAVAAVAAGVVAVGVGIGTWSVSEHRVHDADARLAAEQRRAAAVEQVLSAPDARFVHTAGRDGGTVTVVVSHTRNAAVAVLTDMPALSGDRTYQLWKLDEGGGATSAGLLPADGARPLGDIADTDTIGVSVERKGGATQPTDVIGKLAIGLAGG